MRCNSIVLPIATDSVPIADCQLQWLDTDRWTGAPVNTEHPEGYSCVVADVSLYFNLRRLGGLGASNIYRAQRLADWTFAEPVNVGPPINTSSSESDTFVAPDESYLIVTSRRPGGFG